MARGNRRSFQVEHHCPQCGGPVLLEETDRLFTCEFCRVRLFLHTDGCFHYCLPTRKGTDPEELFYMPYWRFLGMAFACEPFQVRGRILDTSFRATDHEFLSSNLGYRQQTQRLHFATRDSKSRFFGPIWTSDQVLERVQGQASMARSMNGGVRVFHSAFLGDTVSIIYTPVTVKRRAIYDALTDEVLARYTLMREEEFAGTSRAEAGGAVRFASALCPDCGWDLEGERDSVVLLCGGCGKAWEARGGEFRRTSRGTLKSAEGAGDQMMPFWRLEVAFGGFEAPDLAAFARAANFPIGPRPRWENRPVSFWAPAFRIAPRQFLRLGRQLSQTQPEVDTERPLPRISRYPATLSSEEFLDGLKVLFASTVVAKRKIFPELSEITVSLERATLVYLPFRARGGDFLQPDTGLCIHIGSLRRA